MYQVRDILSSNYIKVPIEKPTGFMCHNDHRIILTDLKIINQGLNLSNHFKGDVWGYKGDTVNAQNLQESNT